MARTDFVLFGAAHLAILSSVPAAAALLGWWGRRRARTLRFAAGAFLLVNELIWQVFKYHRYHIPFPEGLPLQLCDLALWMTIAACFTLKPWVFEVAYYTGLGGSAQAVLTPDLWEPFPSYPTIYFFLAHAGLMIVILALIWSGQARPRPGSLWRGLGAANARGPGGGSVQRDVWNQLHVPVPQARGRIAAGLVRAVAMVSGGGRVDGAGGVHALVVAVPAREGAECATVIR
jgi:hypothetical integral membrane protein (TIGR02206 family)